MPSNVPRKKRTTRYVRKGNKGVRSNAIAKEVKKQIMKVAETKSRIYSTTESTYSSLNSPALSYNLNILDQGTESFERDGNDVNGMMMDIRGSIHSTHQEALYHKIIVIECNKQSDPLVDLMENNSGSFAPASSDLTAIYARLNTTKYRILATRLIKTGTASNTANDANAAKLFNIKFKTPGKYSYDENSVVCQKRDIRMLVFSRRSNNDEITGLNSEFTFNAKWYFKDM